MRIAVLSDPNNFHTQKWATALQNAGAEVIVFSYDAYLGNALHAVQLPPPIGRPGKYSYLDYLRGGKVLAAALDQHQIEVLNPLNITPFGVWAARSGFHPTLACAFGADILEYPPAGIESPATGGRFWESQDLNPSRASRWKSSWKRRFFRKKVASALDFADLITGDNQFLVDCMREWFGVAPEKLQLLRWGVEPPLFEPDQQQIQALRARLGLEAQQKLVLSPRGAKPIYQADIILEAIEGILKTGREDTVFLQLGAGYALAPAIQAKAQAMMARSRFFHFIPEALPRTQLHQLWNLVDVFISAPVYDGYSAALAEGRFVGAIPIVNDIPANQELIQHRVNGWICAPFTANQLQGDLMEVLDQCAILKPTFAAANRVWMQENSMMAENARKFLQSAQALIRG